MIHLLNANALHIPLAANTVQCVITSPPYWGLRDYGTAEWVGGSGDCDHKNTAPSNDNHQGDRGTKNEQGHYFRSSAKYINQPNFKHHCPKCGAIRKDAQLGLEATPAEFLANMVSVFREVWRVLKDDGCIWVNMGDSYGDGKQLQGMPWRLAFALQSDGWILRSDIIWHKPNPMPESVTDRPTKAHEYVFLLSKQGRYFYDADAIKEPRTSDEQRPSFRGGAYVNNGTFLNGQGGKSVDIGNVAADDGIRNRRTVWTVATQPYSGSHFATFPTALVEPMILAGSRPGDLVLDPFSGTATVGEVSRKHHRRYVGLELNPEYIELAKERTQHIQPTLLDFNSVMP